MEWLCEYNFSNSRIIMRTETRNNGINDYQVIIAEEGKMLRRKEDGWEAGDELALGYSHYKLVDGEMVKRDEPLLELPEHYEEIDAPVYEDGNEEG